MKNIKTKIISIVLIGFLCILIGSPFINGETTTKTLAPNEYWGLGTTLNTGDTLNFRIESDPLGINIYIMTQGQVDLYIDNPQDKATSYIKKWEGYYLLTSSFVAESSQMYYVHMINPSDSLSTYVVIDASIDEYIPPIQKTITITSPTSYDIFENGYNYITWTSTGNFDSVRIELYKNGVFLETIAIGSINDGSHLWYIDDEEYVDSSNYQIKISNYDDNSIYDYSSYFTIECEIDNTFEPINPFENTLIIALIIAAGVIVAGVILVVLLKKRSKKKSREEGTQPQEAIESNIQSSKFCPNCGSTIVLGNLYCSNCGGVI